MNSKIVKLNENEIMKTHKNEHDEYEYYKREITKRNEFNQCYICIYDIPPLKSAYPYHYHTNNTEAFYVLSGEGVIFTEDGEKIVKKGDIVVFPPNKVGAHKMTNTSLTEVLSYIDFDTQNSPDVVRYPDSNKVGIIIQNESSEFYVENTKVDYYKGE